MMHYVLHIMLYTGFSSIRIFTLSNQTHVNQLGGTKCARWKRTMEVGVVRKTEGDKRLAQQKSVAGRRYFM